MHPIDSARHQETIETNGIAPLNAVCLIALRFRQQARGACCLKRLIQLRALGLATALLLNRFVDVVRVVLGERAHQDTQAFVACRILLDGVGAHPSSLESLAFHSL